MLNTCTKERKQSAYPYTLIIRPSLDYSGDATFETYLKHRNRGLLLQRQYNIGEQTCTVVTNYCTYNVSSQQLTDGVHRTVLILA
jgi:hypothetical protein